MAVDLKQIADVLGIDVPECYCSFISEFDNSSVGAESLSYHISNNTESVISLNEQICNAAPIAGLQEFPDEYFVFGEDGSGNYYLVSDVDESVLFYDHEADNILRIADTLNEFANYSIEGSAYAEIVVHSGFNARRDIARLNPQKPTVVVLHEDDPAWSKDWLEFVEEFTKTTSLGEIENKLTARLNEKFGARPVCWVGELSKISLGQHKLVRIKMPCCKHISGSNYIGLDSLTVSLRTEEENYDDVQVITPEIRTKIDTWKSAVVGDTIHFSMMIAPGRGHKIPCIRIKKIREDRLQLVTINNCGADLLEIL